MQKRTEDFYAQLTAAHRRPPVFAEHTTSDLWDDDHISQQMLAFHLDPDAVPASRPATFIDRSARWIIDRFRVGAGMRVADFGCGPGLYTSRFAAAGASVTGIDFSRRSVAHARDHAARNGLEVEYLCADYLQHRPQGPFDLITMIYCDLCALDPARRQLLLKAFADLLADGGSVLLDVWTLPAYDAREESSCLEWRLMDGFWAPGDYWGFRSTLKYDEAAVVLDLYTIVEERRTRQVYNWLQYYTREALVAELAACGLTVTAWYGDVAGSSPKSDDEVFAVVLTRNY